MIIRLWRQNCWYGCARVYCCLPDTLTQLQHPRKRASMLSGMGTSLTSRLVRDHNPYPRHCRCMKSDVCYLKQPCCGISLVSHQQRSVVLCCFPSSTTALIKTGPKRSWDNPSLLLLLCSTQPEHAVCAWESDVTQNFFCIQTPHNAPCTQSSPLRVTQGARTGMNGRQSWKPTRLVQRFCSVQ